MKRRTFLGGTAGLTAAAALDVALPLSPAQAATSAETPHVAPVPSYATGVGDRASFDEGWRFFRGDIEIPHPGHHGETYGYTKAGAATGPAGAKYDDSSWRLLDLPHDFVVEEPFDPNANDDQGAHPKGIGWYRRTFTLPASDRGERCGWSSTGCTATAWSGSTATAWAATTSGYTALLLPT